MVMNHELAMSQQEAERLRKEKAWRLWTRLRRRKFMRAFVRWLRKRERYTKTYFAGGQYNNMQWPNCIDPAPFYDEQGRLWMAYGSWSGGIFLLGLDPKIGRVIHPQADEENQVDPDRKSVV